MSMDWSKIRDENDFRDLCNYLLKEELGWSVVSVARGKDEGIDASFEGEYKAKKGKWIFQYKWLDPKNGKDKNKSLLKSKLVGGKDPECTRVFNRHNPDHYIVLTNLDFSLPQKRSIADQAQKLGLSDVAILDQADIESLLVEYPSAVRKFFQQSQPVLENYSEKFKKELEDPLSIYFCGEEAPFYGRDKDIQYLNQFLESKSKILTIYGRGGVGKTRLMIEVNKYWEKNKDNIKTYFVRESSSLTFEELISEIPFNRKGGIVTVLIFDDVHNFSRELLSQVNNLLRQSTKTNVKVIFITRPELKHVIMNSLPTQGEGEKVDEYELNNLDISDIRKIIEKYIEDPVISRQTTEWARIGRWNPLEAILVVKESLISGKSFKDVVTESQLLDRLFSRYLQSYSTDDITLLELTAFLQPLRVEDPETKKKILAHLGWEENKYLIALDNLTDPNKVPITEILTYREKRLKVRPDIMGDWLRNKVSYNSTNKLSERAKKIVKDFILSTTEQLLTNVSQTEYGKEEKILDDVIQEIEKEASEGNNSQRIELLKYLKKLAWFRASETLLIVKKIINNPKPDFVIPGYESFKVTHEYVLREIPDVLSDVAYHLDYFPEVISLLFNLALNGLKYPASKAEEELLRLVKIKYRRSLEYNVKALDFIYKNNDINNEAKAKLSLEIIKEQFVTSVDYDYLDPEDPRKLHWTTYPIKAIYSEEGFEKLRKHRETALNYLFQLIANTTSTNVRKLTVDTLPGIIGGILFQNRGLGFGNNLEDNMRYPSEPEMGMILDFVEALVQKEKEKEDHDFILLDSVIGCLNAIKEEKTPYDSRVKSIRLSIKNSDEYRFYDLLLAEHRDWDKDWNRRQLPYLSSTPIKRIVNRYKSKPKEITIFLESLLSLRPGWIFGSVKKLATEIGEKYPKLAEEILKEIKEGQYPYLAIYGGYFIIGIRAVNKKQADEIVDSFTGSSSAMAQRMAIDSYDKYWIVNHQDKRVINVQEKELVFLERLQETTDSLLKLKIASACSAFLMLNKPKTLEILKKLSDSIQKEELNLVGAIAEALDPRDTQFTSDDLDALKSILRGFVVASDLDEGQMMYWHIEQIMEAVLKMSPEFIIDFYQARIEKKNQLKDGEEYDAVPFRVQFPSISDIDKEVELCKRVRDWALQKNWFRLEAPRFISNFGFSLPAIEKVIKEWIENTESDPIKKHELITLAAYLLRDFKDSEWLYDLLALICKKLSLYETDDEKYKDIMGEVMACIYTGSSSGDSKQRAVISNLNRILEQNKDEFCSRVKTDLTKEIQRQEEEARHLNDLLNGDW